MHTKKVVISDAVRTVFRQSKFTDTTVDLPEKLDRSLYEEVVKVIDAVGGKWSKKLRTHVFPAGVDPRQAILAEAFEAGGAVVHQKKTRQAFYTPLEIAQLAAKRAEILPEHDVLEPSAGGGALVRAINHYGPRRVTAVELNTDACIALIAQDNPRTNVIEADFLTRTPRIGMEASKRRTDLLLHDRIVMNPPFTKGQDVEHVQHAFNFLKSGGRLVAIMSPAMTFRATRPFKGFREWLERNTEDRQIEAMPEGAFAESGTNVSTIMLSCRYVPTDPRLRS